MQSLMGPEFQGLRAFLSPQNVSETSPAEAIQDDLEGEQETIPDLEEPALEVETLLHTIGEASKGVSEGTADEYRRLMSQCEAFLLHKKLLKPEMPFFSKRPPELAAQLIVAWIMNHCDDTNLDGTKRPHSSERATYGYAQKMRAAMTYGFGRVHGLGNMPWQERHVSETCTEWVGNPSVSETVSTYMLSLRRRKVQAGEVPTSARAITPEVLGHLYHFNRKNENWKLTGYAGPRPKKGRDEDALAGKWGGPHARRLLYLAYTLAFTCLLRVDEVLKIQAHDIHIADLDATYLTLTLPFRKTSQFGEIRPFVLHEMPAQMAHLCPVRAYAEWVAATGNVTGYVFRRLGSGDRPSGDGSSAMTSEQFLEMFRNNLLDIQLDPFPYGTHSFRRGGCQWLSVDLRWHLREICEWGGWSSEFTHLTIVKYLISWNDNPMHRREDFFNFCRPPTLKCWSCGRSCHCA